MSLQYDLYRPHVKVWQDGRIQVDWYDSYEETYDKEGDSNGGCPIAPGLLDTALGNVGNPVASAMLRNLANYMEHPINPIEASLDAILNKGKK